MSKREELREELLGLIETHKEGFGAGTPETIRIDALIDELVEFTPYPGALNHPEIFRGHWEGSYFSFGRLVGGDGATDQGKGVSTSLKVFSMGRLPDVPATQLYSGLEVDPDTGGYNFYSRFRIGENQIDSHHFAYGRFKKKEENLDRFFVEFDGFEIIPTDPDMSIEDYCEAIGVESADELKSQLKPSPKLWSHIAYMDDDIRIQLGQLGGHYVMLRTDKPMYSIEHLNGKVIPKTAVAAE
ncbi:MAG: hypothetical protein RIC29_17150 [Rhodospirillaceae bacterium]